MLLLLNASFKQAEISKGFFFSKVKFPCERLTSLVFRTTLNLELNNLIVFAELIKKIFRNLIKRIAGCANNMIFDKLL